MNERLGYLRKEWKEGALMEHYSREYISTLLGSFMYLGSPNVNRDGYDTLGDVLNRMEGNTSGEYQILRDALKRDTTGELKNLRISDTSWSMGGEFENTGACLFTNPGSGDRYVVFRGTQDGEWLDNAVAMASQASKQQKNATLYFDSLVKRYGWTQKNGIVLTGHSKGGNKAQFVTLDAKFKHLIDEVYSLDGQGFSPEAVAFYKESLGDEYDSAIKKMRAINGENDYVHPLGITIIPEEQTQYIKQETKENPMDYHFACNLFEKRDGTYTSKVMEEADGEGTLAKTMRRTSGYLMTLDREDREDAAKTIMQAIELINGGKIVGFDGENGFLETLPFLVNTSGKLLLVLVSSWAVEELSSHVAGIFEKFFVGSADMRTFISLITAANFILPLRPFTAGSVKLLEKVYDFVSEKVEGTMVGYFVECFKHFTEILGTLPSVIEREAGGCARADYEVHLSILEGQAGELADQAAAVSEIREELKAQRDRTQLIIKFNPIMQYHFIKADFKLGQYGRKLELMGLCLVQTGRLYQEAERLVMNSYEGGVA